MTLPFSTLTLATGNAHKAKELARAFRGAPCLLRSLADCPQVMPVEEDGAAIRDNACKKASGYARQLGAWVLADDTGLEVAALGGEPGVRSARYAGDQATMPENRAKLIERLRDVSPDKRRAQFVCHLAISDPAGEIYAEAVGVCRGRICDDPRGQGGIGYDALFEIVEYRRRLAELGPAATQRLGHRGRAVEALLKELRAGRPRLRSV
ncbi:MAG: non-canonical purine NTP pyrophosphatase [Blastopirellula sp. JB062]